MAFKDKALSLASVALTPFAYTDKTTGEQAYVKRMTFAEREAYSKMISETPKGDININAFLAVSVDKDGKPNFTDKDIDTIKKMPDDIIYDAIEAFQKARITSVDDAEKNSEPRI